MKNKLIALLSLLLLPLSSCGEGDDNKKNIEYINEKEAYLYTLRDNRQLFNCLNLLITLIIYLKLKTIMSLPVY